MAKLKATRSVLYQNRLYGAGDELPTTDAALVNAWLDAKSAVWDEEKPAKQTETTPGTASGVKQASQSTKTNGSKKASKK
jgi:hypothetical protein